MKRPMILVQLLIGWLPVWAVFVAMVLYGHPGISTWHAVGLALRNVCAAAILGLAVQWLAARRPWPGRFSIAFIAQHVVAAIAFSAAWILLNSLIESALSGRLVFIAGIGVRPYFTLGIWIYVMVAGVCYATAATERAARAEAAAVQAQLAALRGQLHPHFLFNALHSVVHLIPREPSRAARAAEQLGALLRTTIEENRDLVPLAAEWAFVERYLDLERLRFGDRLHVRADIPAAVNAALVPSFSVQTLVENAVRHGVAPRVEPTEVTVTASVGGAMLTVVVRNAADGASGSGAPDDAPSAARTPGDSARAGTGLDRLRERLAALYAVRAKLEVVMSPTGTTATMSLPFDTEA